MSIAEPRAKGNTGLAAPNTRLAIAIMITGIFFYSLNDAIGKWLVATYSVGQVAMIRGLAALVFLSPMIWKMGWPRLFALERPKWQILRVIFSTLDIICFYAAVVTLPLATVMTFWLAGPIYVAALSPLFLGEKVGLRRWLAILAGFIGVLIALNPGTREFSPAVVICLIGSFSFALLIMTGRMLRGTPDTTLAFWQVIGAVLAGAVMAPVGWVTPTMTDFSVMAMLGGVMILANLCVNRALKLADSATVVPFQYTFLFWGVLFGWLMFGDVPQASLMLGALIIVASGLFIFSREQKLKKQV